ncbi:M23 family metallopeptidase [Pleionea mediterranea]|uniref:Murein DD-endopeptidase MepM/ murein hydrolase activator NlpD n=1 Tax=Pleionea mediterranea TaxID=523701 RepID=A0A316FLG6_9GAMM|nr:M23 family metallopeptidase [Pleionea mediterranea]PWK49103.1 murein DD-endopeptidase MepM/ murein hydrolase activator NlpD [Pleionea mediterranea]
MTQIITNYLRPLPFLTGLLVSLILIQPVSANTVKSVSAASSVANKTTQSPLTVLQSKLVQGGFLIGQVKAGTQVEFLDRNLVVNSQRQFIIGFGRDFPDTATLKLTHSNTTESVQFNIRKRQWKIERIDGLPPSKVNPKSAAVLKRIAEDVREIKKGRAMESSLNYFLHPFIYPAKGRISGVYGSQRVLNGEPKRPHYGQDIAAPVGTPVIAPLSGIVRVAHPDMFYSGATVILDHGHGLTSTYLHLDKIHVTVGQEIKQGELMATIGQSGRATGPHLDWRINWHNQRLDPALFIDDTLEKAAN